MKILVLGAGVVGVTSAWYLARVGHEVTVIDRQPSPAQETSFANGGQISVSHAEPWANPGAPAKIMKWMGREDSPLLWRLRADWAQWRWGLAFLAECAPARTRANIGAIVGLGLYSRARLQALRSELGLHYDELTRGILHFYSDPAEFEQATRQAAVMREFGCDRVEKSAAECRTIEPALAGSTVPIVGGTFTASDESGDARVFTQALADDAKKQGVNFIFNAPVDRLEHDGAGVCRVRLVSGECYMADAYVVALGSYAPALLAPLGVRLPVYPAKGYSATIPLADDPTTQRTPTVSLTDDGHKLVFSRLGNRLRVAGTAEFNGHDTSINPQRCAALMRRVTEVFPDLSGTPDVEYWAGLRPSTPNNVPVIGRTRLSNLWLNSGHGTLGWTLACGSASLLTALLQGETPDVDPAPYAP
jgi:D-amino-acid dehydrogenase